MASFHLEDLSFDLCWQPAKAIYPSGVTELSSSLILTVENRSHETLKWLEVGVTRFPWLFSAILPTDAPKAISVLAGNQDGEYSSAYYPMSVLFHQVKPGTKQTDLVYTMNGEMDDHHYYWLGPTHLSGVLASGQPFPTSRFLADENLGGIEGEIRLSQPMRFDPKHPDLYTLQALPLQETLG